MTGPLADTAAERAIVSVALDVGTVDPARLVAMSESTGLLPAHFFDSALSAVYSTALSLAKQGRSTDVVSVAGECRTNHAVSREGGLSFVSGLLTVGGIEAAAPSYAESIRGFALRRRMVELSNKLREQAQNEARVPAETLAEHLRTVAAIQVRGSAPRTLTAVMDECLQRMEENAMGKLPEFVKTGIPSLDNVLGGGLQPSVLTLIGAEPGVGKSAILASIASNAAQSGSKIGVFSLEDDATWLAWRVLASHSEIHQPILKCRRLGQGQQQRLSKGIDQIITYSERILVDDRPALTPGEICQTASAMIVQYGAQAILVDHLGEVRFDGHGDRYDLAIGDGLRQIRDVAKRHKVPIVVASQLARRKGRGPGDMPSKSDFRNSGDIEAIARVMLGVAREPEANRMKIGILKNTNGAAGIEVEVEFHGVAAMVREVEGEVREFYSDEADR